MSNQDYVSMSVESQDCKACGASISFGEGSFVKCEFCSTENRLLKPLKLHQSTGLDLKGDRQDSYNNMLKICETSMVAGSYTEAYDYCNKLLEIDPENGKIYANKGVCSLYNSTVGNIYDGARDISTFIKTALRYSPDSDIVKETAENIAYNLYHYSCYAMVLYHDEKFTGIYHAPDLKGLLSYIKVWDVAFEIHNDTEFLKNAVIVISGHALNEPIEIQKLAWKKMEAQGVKSSIIRNAYIKKIQKLEPDYNPPSIKGGFCFIATATMGDYNHPTVLQLRFFRDTYLLQRKWGRIFTRLYYKWGPYPASLIKKSVALKTLSYYTIVKPLSYIASKIIER